MRTHLKTLVWFAALVVASVAVNAQEKEKPELTGLKLQVVISRWQGEKKISSMPYTLSVNSPAVSNGAPRQGRANIRMGAKIPVVMLSAPPVPGPDGKAVQAGPVQYQDVGTNIDCFTTQHEGGRFVVDLIIDDTSVYEDQAKREQPTFRSFKASDSMMLRDGQSAQFTAATDKVTGEVTKVDVTLTVVR